jgi:hypothetical protein
VDSAVFHIWVVTVGALIAGCTWAAVDAGLAPRARLQRWTSLLARGTLLLLAVAALGVGVAKHATITHRASSAWHAFQRPKAEDAVATSSRFTSASNNGRIELWRTAVIAWHHHELRGVGAGNFADTYYRYHRSGSYARQPHNLLLEALSERGLVGGVLLGAFLVLVLASPIGTVRRVPPEQAALTVALLGTFVQWAIHSQLEWFWQLPAVTLLPLLAAGMLLARAPLSDAPVLVGRPWVRIAAGIGVAFVAVIVALPWVAERSMLHADAVARSDFAAAKRWYAQANALDDASPAIAQHRADAAAVHGDRIAADGFAKAAVSRAPDSWWSYAWLAEYELDAHRPAEALKAAQRAEQLDPHDNYLPARCRGSYTGTLLYAVSCGAPSGTPTVPGTDRGVPKAVTAPSP